MVRITTVTGGIGILIVAAAIIFAFIHPSDLLIIAGMVNLAFLLLGWFFFSGTSFSGKGGDTQKDFFTQVLLLRFAFISLVILVNLLLRNEILRAKILSDPLRKVLSLQGKTYEWKREQFPGENFPGGKDTGVIAQEIEKVLPELVGTRRDGYKGVAYQEIVPILIEAVKEQQKIIDNQRKEISEIKVMLQGMKR